MFDLEPGNFYFSQGLISEASVSHLMEHVFNPETDQGILDTTTRMFLEHEPIIQKYRDAFAAKPEAQTVARLANKINHVAGFNKSIQREGTIIRQFQEFLENPFVDPLVRDCRFPAIILFELIKDIPSINASITTFIAETHPYVMIETQRDPTLNVRISFEGDDTPRISRNVTTLSEWQPMNDYLNIVETKMASMSSICWIDIFWQN